MAFGPLLAGCVVQKTAVEGGSFVTMAAGAAVGSPAAVRVGAAARGLYTGCPAMTFTRTSSGKPVSRKDFVNARMATVGSQLTGAYQAIGSRAPATAKLIAATYPRLFSQNAQCVAGLGFTSEDVDWIRTSVDRLDAAIDRRARMEGFDVVDTREAFDDNLLCDNSSRSWITGVHLFDLQESFHPNQSGNVEYARLVQRAIDGESSGLMRASARAASSDGSDAAASELAEAGFTAEEIAEIAGIDVEYVDIVQLGALTQTEQCTVPVPGETLAYNGGGFAPGSQVRLAVAGVLDPVEVTADEDGNVAGTLMLSLDVPEGVVAIDLSGVGRDGRTRILSAMSPFETNRSCEDKARAALIAFEGGEGGTGSLTSGSLGSSGSSRGSSGAAGSSGTSGSSGSTDDGVRSSGG